MSVLKDHSLAAYTSWRVGGHARQALKAKSLNELSEFLQQQDPNERYLWLGLGSNMLLPDGEIDCTAILTLGGIQSIGLTDDPSVIRAEAGVTCAKLAKHGARAGCSALAFFAGVPGTVGGALAMNAGAFGGETWPLVVAVETIDRQGNLHLRTPHEFRVSYRSVQPAQAEREEWFVAGHFKLSSGDVEQAQQQIKQHLKKRSDSQPIGSLNCGSVFKNPPGDHAARLIEAAGLKGFQQGPVWVSSKHANFIIHEGGASAADLLGMIRHVHDQVFQQFGVDLEPEVKIYDKQAHMLNWHHHEK